MPPAVKLAASVVGAVSGAKAAKAQDEMAGSQADLADEQAALARFLRQRYEESFVPLEDQLISTAQQGLPADYYAQRAGADVGQQYGVAHGEFQRGLQRHGLDPSSGRYAGEESDFRLAEAAARAGAMTSTRREIEDINFQRMLNVASLGRGLPQQAQQGLGAAGSAYGQQSQQYGQAAGSLASAGMNIGLQIADLATAQLRTSNAGAASTTGNALQGAVAAGIGRPVSRRTAADLTPNDFSTYRNN